MKLRELMTRRVLSVQEDDELALALQMMLWSGIRHLPVVRDGRVVGVLSERDVLPRRKDPDQSVNRIAGQVRDAMSKPPAVIQADADVDEAAAQMTTLKVGCLPVLEGESLVGIVTMTDLARQFVATHAPGAPLTSRTAGSLMTPDPAVANRDDFLMDAAARMRAYRVRHLPVIDGERRVIGILSDRDVRDAMGDPWMALLEKDADLEPGQRLTELRVGDAMSREPIVVREGDSITRIVHDLTDARVGALPVVDHDERLVGIVSYLDVLAALAAEVDRPSLGP